MNGYVPDVNMYIFIFLILLKSFALGKQSWCLENSNGFSLTKDYNRNSPPSDPFNITIDHVLMTLDKVWDRIKRS